MEDLFYGLLALLFFIAPLWALFTNIRKTRRLESEMWDVRKRLALPERSLEQSPAKRPLPSASFTTIAPHQLATLIDLETLETRVCTPDDGRITERKCADD